MEWRKENIRETIYKQTTDTSSKLNLSFCEKSTDDLKESPVLNRKRDLSKFCGVKYILIMVFAKELVVLFLRYRWISLYRSILGKCLCKYLSGFGCCLCHIICFSCCFGSICKLCPILSFLKCFRWAHRKSDAFKVVVLNIFFISFPGFL